MSTFKIAIDGPAGAGKSTIAKKAAAQMDFVYIDTGAMYRAIGLAAVRQGLRPDSDISGIVDMLPDVNIDLAYGENGQEIFLNGENVSTEIRLPEISVAASDVSKIPEVRAKLLELQRSIAEKTDVIMDGRDIGTVVLPDAQLKIFLTASVEERARRRFEELKEKGIECDFEEVKRDMEYRDKNDSEREIAPLRPAEDSVVLDTTGNTLEQSVELILGLIKERREV
ncbi:MAG: (d)CMP kinase [Ruminococcaceae bacterium]|nr:(d)CMP kinase [Oscillospiraceae bacterium]